MLETWGRHGRFNVSTLKKRFEKKTRREGDCLIWTGARGSHGRYGSLAAFGEPWLAHRLAYALSVGDIPVGMVVCHRCDNGLCVNPDHLFLGSQSDNVNDMEAKERSVHPRGEAHGRAKLTSAQVLLIRDAHASGQSGRSLARAYGVTKTNIAAIVKRQIWATT